MPATANPLIVPGGIQGVVHYLSSGSRASWGNPGADGIVHAAAPGSLVAMTFIRNVTLNVNREKGDGSARRSNWKLYINALKDASIDLEAPWTPTDAGQIALATAFFADSTIALAILDGLSSVSSSQGLWADFIVDEYSREEPIEKEMLLKVKLIPAATAIGPQWVQCS